MRLAVLASLAALTACHSQPPPVPVAAPRPSGTRPIPAEDRPTTTAAPPTTLAPVPTTARVRRARPATPVASTTSRVSTTTAVPAVETTSARAAAPPPHPPAQGVPPAGAAGAATTARASWYGRGARTANGERFEPDGHTFAHLTMAFGSLVRFCHAGACVVARCNDRGPARWTGREFDLSRGAFAAIAPLGAGVVDVTWEPA